MYLLQPAGLWAVCCPEDAALSSNSTTSKGYWHSRRGSDTSKDRPTEDCCCSLCSCALLTPIPCQQPNRKCRMSTVTCLFFDVNKLVLELWIDLATGQAGMTRVGWKSWGCWLDIYSSYKLIRPNCGRGCLFRDLNGNRRSNKVQNHQVSPTPPTIVKFWPNTIERSSLIRLQADLPRTL
jgi:hypothetical protein